VCVFTVMFCVCLDYACITLCITCAVTVIVAFHRHTVAFIYGDVGSGVKGRV